MVYFSGNWLDQFLGILLVSDSCNQANVAFFFIYIFILSPPTENGFGLQIKKKRERASVILSNKYLPLRMAFQGIWSLPNIWSNTKILAFKEYDPFLIYDQFQGHIG